MSHGAGPGHREAARRTGAQRTRPSPAPKHAAGVPDEAKRSAVRKDLARTAAGASHFTPRPTFRAPPCSTFRQTIHVAHDQQLPIEQLTVDVFFEPPGGVTTDGIQGLRCVNGLLARP